MENLKIKVNNESESKEIQELFVVLGAVCCSGLERNKNVNFLFMNSGFVTACKLQENFDKSKCKEITILELRDLVVLKRNDIGDYTHGSSFGSKFYHCCNGDVYAFNDGTWVFDHTKVLKPIKEKEMKEYLVKSQDGKWKLETDLVGDPADTVIEVPCGAEMLIHGNSRYFVKYEDGIYKQFYFESKHVENNKWVGNLKDLGLYRKDIVWQRNPEPKQAEFLVKTDSGYVLQVLDENACGADVVRVPDGAEIAILSSGVVYFWKSHFFNGGVHKDWVDMKGGWDASWYLKNVPSAVTIWKRETLNDQVASAEVARQESKEWDLGDYDFAESDALIESNVEQSSIVKTLAERQSTYGDFSKVAEMTQGLLFVMSQYGYSDMPDTHKESIHMIASKLARIVNGDNNHLDSWHDIGGYSKLIENLINSVND